MRISDDGFKRAITFFSPFGRILFLPALVLSEQLVAVGAVVLRDVQRRAAEGNQAAGPTTKRRKSTAILSSLSVCHCILRYLEFSMRWMIFHLHTAAHDRAYCPR
jgi:hypothetical protein